MQSVVITPMSYLRDSIEFPAWYRGSLPCADEKSKGARARLALLRRRPKRPYALEMKGAIQPDPLVHVLPC